jgi:hypothetical protein
MSIYLAGKQPTTFYIYSSILVLILNNKAMWYNKIVMNDDSILSKEKYYVNDVWEIEEECGIDIMGNFVCEFWSED